MRIDVSDYVALTGRRPRGRGAWVFEIVAETGESFLFHASYSTYQAAAEEVRLKARRAGRRSQVVLCP